MNSLVLLILGTGMALFARGVFNPGEEEKAYSSKRLNKRAYHNLLLVK
ncbi:hypothetical protein KKH56_04335 [bacterium]|nr:hypothetical protein [bacterium]